MADGSLTDVTLSRAKKTPKPSPVTPPPSPLTHRAQSSRALHRVPKSTRVSFKRVLFVFYERSGVLYCAYDVQGRVSATGPADDGRWSVALRRTGARVERTATEGSHRRSFTPVDRQRNVTRFDNTVVFFRYRVWHGEILEFAETRDSFRRKIKTVSYVRDTPFWNPGNCSSPTVNTSPKGLIYTFFLKKIPTISVLIHLASTAIRREEGRPEETSHFVSYTEYKYRTPCMRAMFYTRAAVHSILVFSRTRIPAAGQQGGRIPVHIPGVPLGAVYRLPPLPQRSSTADAATGVGDGRLHSESAQQVPPIRRFSNYRRRRRRSNILPVSPTLPTLLRRDEKYMSVSLKKTLFSPYPPFLRVYVRWRHI